MTGRGRRALVVEDDALSLELLSDILGSGGWSVTAVASGEEAVAAASRSPPDLVLLDIGLPGIDGRETMRRLRRLPETAGAAVVAVTAQAMAGDAERALAEGFDGYLTKPLDTRGLLRVLDAILTRRR